LAFAAGQSAGGRWGEWPLPRLYIAGRRRGKFKRSRQPTRVSVVNSRARGRSMAHTTERETWSMRPPREKEERPDPTSIVPASKPRSYAPSRSTQATSGPRWASVREFPLTQPRQRPMSYGSPGGLQNYIYAQPGRLYEVSSYFRWHQEHEHQRRAGRPPGQTDCRIQRPLHSHRGVPSPHGRSWRGMALHQQTRTQVPDVLTGLEVLGSTGAHRAAQHR
jgi:hypothetical protein